MAKIFLDDQTAGKTYVARFTQDSDGYVWSGSAWVAPTTLTDAELASAINGVTLDAVVNESATHIGYSLTVPAGITTACHISVYLTSYAAGDAEDYGADYDPQVEQILEDTGTTLPASISAIGSGTGAALNFEVVADNATSGLPPAPLTPVTKLGTETGTFANTLANDGTVHSIASEVSGTNKIDWVYKFTTGAGRNATKVVLRASMGAVGDTVTIQVYNFATNTWDTRTTITGTTETLYDVPLLSGHTGTGANAGFVYIRFLFDEGDAGTLVIDECYVQAQNLGQTVGYADGAIWIGGANANTTPYVDGTADNPVTYAAAKTLSASIGLTKFRVRNGTTVTLDAATANKTFIGSNWTLALGGQDISGSYFEGAVVTGSGSGTASATFVDCQFGNGGNAVVTVPPLIALRCGVNCVQNYALTAAAAGNGQYVFTDCYSLVAGSGTPYFDFSPVTGSSGVNFRRWSGGSNITLDSNCTMTMEVVTGGGQTVAVGAAASVEIRGICRQISLTGITSASTVQIDAVTGPISIAGADGTVNIYGVCGAVTDSRTGTPTLSTFADINADATAIKTKTDNLPTDPADQSAVEAAIAVVAGYIDTEVEALGVEIAKIPRSGHTYRWTNAESEASVDLTVGEAD